MRNMFINFWFVVWLIFGFEHAFDGMYHALLGVEEKPIDVMGKDIINVILVSVAIGILLVILAMCLNIYSSLKQKIWAVPFWL